MTMTESYFKGAAQAKVTQQGLGFSAGDIIGKGYNYTVKVLRNSVEKTEKGNLFLSRLEIIDTNDPNATVGEARDHKIWFSNKSAFGNCRALIHALLGYDEISDKAILSGNGKVQNHIEDLLQWSVGPENPLKNVEVKLETMLRVAKTIHTGQTAPSKYVFCTWHPIVKETTPFIQAAAFKAVNATSKS